MIPEIPLQRFSFLQVSMSSDLQPSFPGTARPFSRRRKAGTSNPGGNNPMFPGKM